MTLSCKLREGPNGHVPSDLGSNGLARTAPCRKRIEEDNPVAGNGLPELLQAAEHSRVSDDSEAHQTDPAGSVEGRRYNRVRKKVGDGGGATYEAMLCTVILGELVVNDLVAVGKAAGRGPRMAVKTDRRSLDCIGKKGRGCRLWEVRFMKTLYPSSRASVDYSVR
jgi:hypothetical protein